VVDKPEIIVAFVIPQISSGMLSHDLGAYSQSQPSHTLKSIIGGSTSFLSVPYTTGSKLSDELIEVVSHGSGQAEVIDKSDCNNVLINFQKQQGSGSLLSNGITDLVIIQSNNNQNAYQCMQQLLQYIDINTNGHYLSLLTSDSAPPMKLVVESKKNLATERSAASPVSFVQSFESTDASKATSTLILPLTGYVAFASPTSMLVVLLSVFLIFVLLIGVSFVISIESPPRFAIAPMQIPKEY